MKRNTSTIDLGFNARLLADGKREKLWPLEVAPKNIYVAASLHARVEALSLAYELVTSGLTVTSSWVNKSFADIGDPMNHDDYSGKVKFWQFERQCCEDNIRDLELADTLILLADIPSSSGGYHFEFGYYLGRGLTNIVVVTKKILPNCFYLHEPVRFTASTEGLIGWLKEPCHGPQAPRKPAEDFDLENTPF